MQSFLRKGKSANAEYTKGDTQAFILLPYYVEMLFSRFDRDGNGEIDNDEANRAYPVFRPFLSKKATEKGLNKPEDHYAVFNFLLAYRELPTEDKWEFAIRRYLLGPKKFSVNRSQVVEIFAKLLSL